MVGHFKSKGIFDALEWTRWWQMADANRERLLAQCRHFREEFQTPDGEARRDDENFAHVAAWEHAGDGQAPRRHVEPLQYEFVHLATRSYK